MANDVWTVKRILDWIEGYLADRGDENPRLSAQWLVSEALDVSRIQLFMDPDRPLSLDERDILRDFTRRRGQGEPLQYITGTTDFRFITVQVEHGVLIPRPETEVLVSEALSELDTASQIKISRRVIEVEALEGSGSSSDVQSCQIVADQPTLKVIDLCTGSGCIACSIASEVPHAQVIATDIDPKAISLAQLNVDSLDLSERVQVIACDLGEGVPADMLGSIDLVISNPPYIPTEVLDQMDSEVIDYESSLALDGGEDGLDIFRRILPFAHSALSQEGVLALELHETCLVQAAKEAMAAGFESVRIAEDLAGRQRVLIARKGQRDA